ncbi:resolvase [Chryseobacterium sp. Leaf405]|uniref:recombinase family protein n=1 Tax=Chryseobacterium sp. Leaf405 TaxID=1736367 RepID=UPI0006F5A527|nr:recombinase family protein [Chryseobacterium sp. Leaf405]KQT35595.1 resolvase [Chryseobacterium sp. Leaf405]
MKIGYARVSTKDQNLDLQIKQLENAGCKKIFKEKISGIHSKRIELDKMIEQLREGDQIIIYKLDRLARSTKDLLNICEKINEAGASFRSLSESWADSISPGGKMILTIFAGIAEFERELIIERTSAGRKLALQNGIEFGRPKKFNSEQKAAVKTLIDNGSSVKQVAETFKVHPATIYRILQIMN